MFVIIGLFIKASSNFMNMSYCMFENTSNDMNQILATMSDSVDEETSLELSSYEKVAIDRLKSQCEDFLQLYENIRLNKLFKNTN